MLKSLKDLLAKTSKNISINQSQKTTYKAKLRVFLTSLFPKVNQKQLEAIEIIYDRDRIKIYTADKIMATELAWRKNELEKKFGKKIKIL